MNLAECIPNSKVIAFKYYNIFNFRYIRYIYIYIFDSHVILHITHDVVNLLYILCNTTFSVYWKHKKSMMLVIVSFFL